MHNRTQEIVDAQTPRDLREGRRAGPSWAPGRGIRTPSQPIILFTSPLPRSTSEVRSPSMVMRTSPISTWTPKKVHWQGKTSCVQHARFACRIAGTLTIHPPHTRSCKVGSTRQTSATEFMHAYRALRGRARPDSSINSTQQTEHVPVHKDPLKSPPQSHTQRVFPS